MKQKSKIKRAKWIVDFLEIDLSIDELIMAPEKSVELAKGLEENFLDQEASELFNEILPSKTKVKKAKRLLKNPSKINTVHQIIGGLVKQVYSYYTDLKPVWDEFKNSLSEYREDSCNSSFPVKIPIESFSVKIPIEIDFTKKQAELSSEYLTMNTKDGKHSLSVKNVVRFLALLEGLTFDRVLKCKGCERWFISTYSGDERQAKHCSNTCASRANKRDLRSNPKRKDQYKKVKKKQQKAYSKKVLGS